MSSENKQQRKGVGEPFIALTDSILAREDLTPAEKIILAYYRSWERRYGKCEVRYDVIAKKVGMTYKTVERSLKKLKSLNLLSDDLPDKLSGKNISHPTNCLVQPDKLSGRPTQKSDHRVPNIPTPPTEEKKTVGDFMGPDEFDDILPRPKNSNKNIPELL